MGYRTTKKIPKKHDFTKNRWPSINYESLDSENLQEKINKIDVDTSDHLDLPNQWEVFLKEYKVAEQRYDDIYKKTNQFYVENLIRKSQQVEVTEFIFIKHKYIEHDVYFKNNDIEDKFFKLYLETVKAFKKLCSLVENNMRSGKHFYVSKFEQTDFSRHTIWKFGPAVQKLENSNFTSHDDVQNFSENWRRTTKTYFEIKSKPRTIRTYDLFEKINKITVDNQLDNKEIPFLPNVSYVKWYSKKIIEENDRIKRIIELILRSRKRSVELAENFNYVYVMSNKSYPKNTYKIGWTSGLPEDRADQLSSETGVLYPFKVEHSKKFKDAENIEKQIHEHFDEHRVRKNKEYFDLDIKKIIEYIDDIEEAKIRTKKHEEDSYKKLLEDEEW